MENWNNMNCIQYWLKSIKDVEPVLWLVDFELQLLRLNLPIIEWQCEAILYVRNAKSSLCSANVINVIHISAFFHKEFIILYQFWNIRTMSCQNVASRPIVPPHPVFLPPSHSPTTEELYQDHSNQITGKRKIKPWMTRPRTVTVSPHYWIIWKTLWSSYTGIHKLYMGIHKLYTGIHKL